MDVQRELRREQNNLVMVGEGVMVLGAWGVLGSLIKIVFENTLDLSQVQADLKDESQLVVWVVWGIVVFFVLAIMFMLVLPHFYVGSRARAQGMGQKVKKTYLSVAFLMALLYGISTVLSTMYLFGYLREEQSSLSLFTTVVMDLVTFAAFVRIFVSIYRIEAYKKRIETGEE